MNDPLTCKHEKFSARVHVNVMDDRVDPKDGQPLRIAEVSLHCEQCSVPFRFLGVEPGIRFDKPTTTIDACELQAPIKPGVGDITAAANKPMIVQAPENTQRN